MGFADIERAIPGGGAYFNDVCHLTTAGSDRFAEALTPVAAALLSKAFPRVDPRAADVPVQVTL
jgi:hypothetical protein